MVLGWSRVCSRRSKKACVLRWHKNFGKDFQDTIKKKYECSDRWWVFCIHFFEPHRKISNGVWLTKDARRPCIAKMMASVKRLCMVPKGKSMNARFYKKKVLRKLVKFFQKCRPTGIRGMHLLHDNASSHKTGSVTSFLNEQGACVPEHPLYSPDLDPLTFSCSLVSSKSLLVESIHPAKSWELPYLTSFEAYLKRTIKSFQGLD